MPDFVADVIRRTDRVRNLFAQNLGVAFAESMNRDANRSDTNAVLGSERLVRRGFLVG